MRGLSPRALSETLWMILSTAENADLFSLDVFTARVLRKKSAASLALLAMEFIGLPPRGRGPLPFAMARALAFAMLTKSCSVRRGENLVLLRNHALMADLTDDHQRPRADLGWDFAASSTR